MQVLYVRDRDELPDVTVAALEAKGPVRVLPVRELENFFLVDAEPLRKAIAERLGTEHAPSGVEIAREMRACADELRSAIVARRVVSQLAPIYPVPWAQLARVLGDEPTLPSLLSAIEENLGSVGSVQIEATRAWEAAEQDLERRWETDWVRLVPGAELLAKLWHAYGLAYDKSRDGLLVAQQIPEPPAELDAIIRGFLMPSRA